MLSIAEENRMKLNLFVTCATADANLTAVMKELEEFQSLSQQEDSNKDCFCDCEKDHCSCCRSTIGDLNTIVADNNQEDFNFDTPELNSCSRSVIKNTTIHGHLSPQFSSRTSQSGNKESKQKAKDPFRVIRQNITTFQALESEKRQEKPGSNKKQRTSFILPKQALVCCNGCLGGKKLIIELAQGGSAPNYKACTSCHQPSVVEKLLQKPLAFWPSFVQYRVNPFFASEVNQSSESMNLAPDSYSDLHSDILLKFEHSRTLYETAFKDLTSKNQASRSITEKILKLREVEDLMNSMLVSRGLLEDLELDNAQRQLFNNFQKYEESDTDSFTPQDDCDPFLGKRRGDEDLELSRFFSWST